MALLPPPDISAAYVDDKMRPSKDFYNWIKSIYDATRNSSVSTQSATWGLNILDYGAVQTEDLNNPIDVTSNVQDAIDAVNSAGSGLCFVPAGLFYVPGGLFVPNEVALYGAHRDRASFYCGDNDVVLVETNNNSELYNLRLIGKGELQNGVGSFGATQPTLKISGANAKLQTLTVLGGSFNIETSVDSGDLNLFDVNCFQPYAAMFLGRQSSWHNRCKYDHSAEAGVGSIDTPPYAAWAAITAYTAGHVRYLSGYLIICSQGGTSGASPPALQNYGVDIIDATATWRIWAPDPDDPGTGFISNALVNSGEVHYDQCDFSSDGQRFALYIEQGVPGANVVAAHHCVISRVKVSGGAGNTCKNVLISGSETGGFEVDNDFSGVFQWSDNFEHEANASAIGNNVADFSIRGSHFDGGAINIGTGCTGYIVKDNTGTAAGANISDGSGAGIVSDNT